MYFMPKIWPLPMTGSSNQCTSHFGWERCLLGNHKPLQYSILQGCNALMTSHGLSSVVVRFWQQSYLTRYDCCRTVGPIFSDIYWLQLVPHSDLSLYGTNRGPIFIIYIISWRSFDQISKYVIYLANTNVLWNIKRMNKLTPVSAGSPFIFILWRLNRS